jgi:hypothetical protein
VEAVSRFIRGRDNAGSYHWLVDAEQRRLLVEMSDEAFHDGTGSNPWSLGISAAVYAADWPTMSAGTRAAVVDQLARAAVECAVYVRRETGVLVPARRITVGESDQGVPGFIAHAQRDPARRSDPGIGFPWEQFLARFAVLASTEFDLTDRTDQEDLMAALSDDQQRQLYNAAIQTRDIAGGARGHAEKALTEVRALRAEVAALAARPGQDVTIDYDALATALLRRIAGQ